MWLALSLLSAVGYGGIWLIVHNTKGIPSSLVTVMQFSLGPLLLLFAAPQTPIPWQSPLWHFFVLFNVAVFPPLSWAVNNAMQKTPVTIANPLSSLTALSALLCGLLFGERPVTSAGVAGVALGIIGLFVLYKGRRSVWRKPWPWMIAGSMLIFGANASNTAALLAEFPEPLFLSGISLSCIFVFPVVGGLHRWMRFRPSMKQWAVLLSLAALTLMQDVATVVAFAYAPSALVISVKRMSIIFTALLGYWLFQERDIPLPRLIGATSIVVCGVILML